MKSTPERAGECAPSEMEKLIRHALWHGLYDWNSLSSVDGYTRAYFHDEQDIQAKSLECMRTLVDEGYAELGGLRPGGFRVSDRNIDEHFEHMSKVYSLPGAGFNFWLRNTERGNAHALEDPENDY